MTTDELKKEAEEKLPQAELDYCHGFMNPCEPSELPYIELVRFRTGFERGYLASAEPREKRIAELEQENAELKKWKEDTIKARGNDYMAWSKMYDQLTKAKEIIKKYIELKNKPCASGHSINMLLYENICAEAEQFLNSEVEK